MTSKPGRKQDTAEPLTPGRPNDASRQQKHEDQHLDSGSRTLDRNSRGEGELQKPTPPGPK